MSWFLPFGHARHPRLHIPLVSGKTRWHHLFTQYTKAAFLIEHYAITRKRILRHEISNKFLRVPPKAMSSIVKLQLVQRHG